jgi:hypothetical protein
MRVRTNVGEIRGGEAGGRQEHAADGGPAIMPMLPRTMESDAAAGMSCLSTRRGTSDSIAGRCSPLTADIQAATRYSIHADAPIAAISASGRAAGGERDVGAEGDPPPIDRVGDRAADERGDEQRHQFRAAEQADCQRRSGEPVHLIRQRDVGDHRAEQRHELRRVEEPEVARAETG